MVSIKNPCFYWLDKNTFILAFDGEFDEDGDDYSYQVKYQKDKGLFVFSRWYEKLYQ